VRISMSSEHAVIFRTIKLEDGGFVGIPCYESNDYRWLIWKEDEYGEQVLKRHSVIQNENEKYTNMSVWPEGEKAGEYSETEISVYKMRCCRTHEIYFLLVISGLHDFECVYHSVAIPYNQFCLLEFFNKYMIRLAGKPYIFGD
jgi:hypothetical protein